MILFLGLILGGAFLLAKAAKPQPTALVTADETPPQTSPAKAAAGGGALAGVGSAAGGLVAEVAAAAGAAVAGYALGSAADKWISGVESDKTTQISGGLAGGVIAAGAVLLIFGTLTGPVYAIIVAAVVLTYVVVVIVDDLERASYGQAGALKDFQKNWKLVFDSCFTHLRAGVSSSITDDQIKRKLIPFIDGYMMEANRLNYLAYMKAPKGVTGLGLDTFGQANHGASRGFFLGDVDLKGQLQFHTEKYLESDSNLFALSYAPPSDLSWELRTQSKSTATGSNAGVAGKTPVPRQAV